MEGTSPVDLRSDTVTRPTPAMREAIAAAEVGDDAYGEDPTARRLEERVAELLGKETALLFPSGIMANQTALHVLGRPGCEAVVEARAHILHWEEGAAATWSGLQLRPVEAPDGILTPGLVEPALREPGGHDVDTALVAMENTHLGSGGRIVPPSVTGELAALCRERGLPLHLDGARLWHAAVAEGRPPAAWGEHADTVMVSLSKGLGCPVGSLLAGSGETVEAARGVRRRLGGQMRQVGVLAAAGLHALEHHLHRLEEDHRRARELARGVDGVEGFSVPEPETNIVLVDVADPSLDPAGVVEGLRDRGVLVGPFGPRRLRAVTHLDVDDDGIRRAVAAFDALVRP